VSDAGDHVVGASSSSATGANGEEAFLWRESEGTLRGLGSLPGGSTQSAALGVSGDGAVVVGEASSSRSGANEREAFRWTEAEGMTALGDLPGARFASRANAISSDGRVVVGASSSAASGTSLVEAFRWTEAEGMQPLGDLPGGLYESEALAASRDGSVIVGTSGTRAGETAFVWRATSGMRSISAVLEEGGVDLGTWRLTAATGVSDDGAVVVGTGIDPFGRDQGWVAVLPEPTASLQTAAVLTALSLLRRRRSGPSRSAHARRAGASTQ
jgi:probable HAF family extracellular repeat protein